MRTGAAWLAAFAVAALVWVASPELRWPARSFAAILLGPAPLLAMWQARQAALLPRPLPRIQLYLSSIAGLCTLAVIAYLAGSGSGIDANAMGLVSIEPAELVLWTLFGLLAGGVVVGAFRAAGLKETDLLREIVPVTNREKIVFCLLSVSAGVCEEIVFRGFLMWALALATGSLFAGVALSSFAFGVLHAHQNAAGALRATILGALLAVPLIVSGSLYPSMLAHTLIDIAGGLWLARWLLK